MGRSDAEVCNSVREPAGGVRAELCQEKRSSSWSVFGRTHGGANIRNCLQSAMIHEMNHS